MGSGVLRLLIPLAIVPAIALSGCARDFDELFSEGEVAGADAGPGANPDSGAAAESDAGSSADEDASASPPKPDAQACANAPPQCQGDNCTYSCELGCTCNRVNCGSKNDESCNATCARASICDVVTTVDDKAQLSCTACTAKFTCAGDARCAMACTEGADCEATCVGRRGCGMTCTGGSKCQLKCSFFGDCDLQCEGQGQLCVDGTRVCNRPCP